jgi:signal transduction histidine kinase
MLEEVRVSFLARAEVAGINLLVEEAEPLVARPSALPSGLTVEADPVRLRQVLANLVENAILHTGAGGSVILGARPEPGGGALLEVRDTGEGISPEALPHIFDRFHRSADSGGSGLGLAIARSLVEAHGGAIEASSPGVAGRGSVFRVRLPGPS